MRNQGLFSSPDDLQADDWMLSARLFPLCNLRVQQSFSLLFRVQGVRNSDCDIGLIVDFSSNKRPSFNFKWLGTCWARTCELSSRSILHAPLLGVKCLHYSLICSTVSIITKTKCIQFREWMITPYRQLFASFIPFSSRMLSLLSDRIPYTVISIRCLWRKQRNQLIVFVWSNGSLLKIKSAWKHFPSFYLHSFDYI